MENIKKVLFVGYGTISKGIISNLIKKTNIKINVWSRNTNFKSENIKCSNDIKNLVRNVQMIISCVPDDEISWSIWTNEIVMQHILKNKIYCVEMSTLSVEYLIRWYEYMEKVECKAIEAPLTGSKAGAENGELSIFLYSKFRNEIRHFFELFSKKIYDFSEPTEPMKFKLIYNVWGAGMLQQLVEMYKVINENIKDKEVAYDIVMNDGWMSKICANIIPRVRNKKEADVNFKLGYMLKDVLYAESLFSDDRNRIYQLIKQLYQEMVTFDNKNDDFSTIVK